MPAWSGAEGPGGFGRMCADVCRSGRGPGACGSGAGQPASPARTPKASTPATPARKVPESRGPLTAGPICRPSGILHHHTARTPECPGKQDREDEAEEFGKGGGKSRSRQESASRIVGNYNEFWYDGNKKVVGTKRTSLIVDPPDGRLPPLTAKHRRRRRPSRGTTRRRTARADARRLGRRLVPADSRCDASRIQFRPPMTPAAYNQNVQIFQTASTWCCSTR